MKQMVTWTEHGDPEWPAVHALIPAGSVVFAPVTNTMGYADQRNKSLADHTAPDMVPRLNQDQAMAAFLADKHACFIDEQDLPHFVGNELGRTLTESEKEVALTTMRLLFPDGFGG